MNQDIQSKWHEAFFLFCSLFFCCFPGLFSFGNLLILQLIFSASLIVTSSLSSFITEPHRNLLFIFIHYRWRFLIPSYFISCHWHWTIKASDWQSEEALSLIYTRQLSAKFEYTKLCKVKKPYHLSIQGNYQQSLNTLNCF